MQNFLFSRTYSKTKLAILTLLVVNVLAYAVMDTLISALDAMAWVILLIMYELESENFNVAISQIKMGWIRNGLIALITLLFVYYIQAREWLDVTNALLWFGLIGLLELEIRRPELVRAHKTGFWISTVAVFAGLISMAGVWIWRAEWLDAYDALLWILAFSLIEVDIFKFLNIQGWESLK